jgi:hypothetical protein
MPKESLFLESLPVPRTTAVEVVQGGHQASQKDRRIEMELKITPEQLKNITPEQLQRIQQVQQNCEAMKKELTAAFTVKGKVTDAETSGTEFGQVFVKAHYFKEPAWMGGKKSYVAAETLTLLEDAQGPQGTKEERPYFEAKAQNAEGDAFLVRWECRPGWYTKFRAEKADEDDACNWSECTVHESN